ncbi:MAG: hypothetical protein IGBAC_0500 [Ignavibacteriae bacterium]|nr:MAG: hypothetical protein IGBAC_0500 [Ignavibacteriota bacterium]
MSKLKCVKICNERFIAEMIQSYLNMHEIESLIQTDPLGPIILGNYSSKGFKIMVKEEDEIKAREVLDNQDFESDSSFDGTKLIP